MGKEDLKDELGGPVSFHSCGGPSPDIILLSGAFPHSRFFTGSESSV